MLLRLTITLTIIAATVYLAIAPAIERHANLNPFAAIQRLAPLLADRKRRRLVIRRRDGTRQHITTSTVALSAPCRYRSPCYRIQSPILASYYLKLIELARSQSRTGYISFKHIYHAIARDMPTPHITYSA